MYADTPALAEGDFGWWHEGFRGWERSRDWAVELLRTGPRIDGIFGLAVPSVHVTGRADAIVPRRDSLLLADRFADPLIIEHPGGHVIPSGTAVTAPIAGFLAGFARDTGAAPALGL